MKIIAAATILGGLICYGLIAVAISTMLSSQPITGGYKEEFSRMVSIPLWPGLVYQMLQVLEDSSDG